jgi:hypothetical protein
VGGGARYFVIWGYIRIIQLIAPSASALLCGQLSIYDAYCTVCCFETKDSFINVNSITFMLEGEQRAETPPSYLNHRLHLPVSSLR